MAKGGAALQLPARWSTDPLETETLGTGTLGTGDGRAAEGSEPYRAFSASALAVALMTASAVIVARLVASTPFTPCF